MEAHAFNIFTKIKQSVSIYNSSFIIFISTLTCDSLTGCNHWRSAFLTDVLFKKATSRRSSTFPIFDLRPHILYRNNTNTSSQHDILNRLPNLIKPKDLPVRDPNISNPITHTPYQNINLPNLCQLKVC